MADLPTIDEWIAVLETTKITRLFTDDEMISLVERNTAFERATARADLSEAGRSRMIAAIARDRPPDLATWCHAYLADHGIPTK